MQLIIRIVGRTSPCLTQFPITLAVAPQEKFREDRTSSCLIEFPITLAILSQEVFRLVSSGESLIECNAISMISSCLIRFNFLKFKKIEISEYPRVIIGLI